MCTNPVGEQTDFSGCFSADSLKSFIEKEKKRNHSVNVVYVSGGEPTIRPDFFESLAYISKSFPHARINILSNGRRFFYADFAEKCLSFSNVNFIIPIHGWDSKSHDAITRTKESFAQTTAGLKNLFALRNPGQEIEIRIIIHKLNYKKLNKIFDLIFKEFPLVDRVVAIFLEYEGHAIKNFKSVELSYKEFFPEFKKLKKYLIKFNEIRFYHFPLCVLPREFWPYMWRTLDADEVIFLPQCGKCAVNNFCLGIHKEYLRLFGLREFKPIKTPVYRRGIKKKILLVKTNDFHHPIIDVKEQKTAKEN